MFNCIIFLGKCFKTFFPPNLIKCHNKLDCLSLAVTFAILHSKGRLLTSPTNVRLGWKGVSMKNTLAYLI